MPGAAAGADLLARVRAALAAEGATVTREVAMFGGRSLMVDEQLLVSVRGDGDLLVTIDPAERDDVLARPGARPAVMGGRRMGDRWVAVGPEGLGSDEDLRRWVRTALEAR